MNNDALSRLLAGQYRDPDTGAPVSVPTRRVVIRDTLAGSEDELIGELGFEGPLAVVSDHNTEQALGRRVKERLRRLGAVVAVVLPGAPLVRPDMATVERLLGETAGAGALVAVGAGSINDLCKYTAARSGRPYAVFATAPSMNGYTSVNASITVGGHKSTLPATGASGVFCDLEVMSAAPLRMIRAGLGDSLSRPTAQADWLLSHLLFGSEYRELPFTMQEDDEGRLLEDPERLVRRDLRAVESLVRLLHLSGFGMTLCGGSYPSSQGEHLISHYVDMLGSPDWPTALHGEHIAVTALTMARLQAAVLEREEVRVSPCGVSERDLLARYGPVLGASFWAEFSRKRLDRERARLLNERLEGHWKGIRETIARILMAPARMAGILRAAGAPLRPEDLGWPREFYQRAVREAREIRNRYTFLDLAVDGGLIDRLPEIL